MAFLKYGIGGNAFQEQKKTQMEITTAGIVKTPETERNNKISIGLAQKIASGRVGDVTERLRLSGFLPNEFEKGDSK